MDDVYRNIDDYNPKRKRKILIVFDDMIADIMTNKNFPQPACGVLETSFEGVLKVLMSGTYRETSGDSQWTNTKIDDLMKRLFFRCNSPCFTHLFFTGKQIFERSKWGRPWDVYGTQLRDFLGTK